MYLLIFYKLPTLKHYKVAVRRYEGRKIDYTVHLLRDKNSEFFPLIFGARRAILDRPESAYGGRNIHSSPIDVSLNEVTGILRPLHDTSHG
jgi:hypothetical protein